MATKILVSDGSKHYIFGLELDYVKKDEGKLDTMLCNDGCARCLT